MSTTKPIFRTPKNEHYFFGYYDKSSLNVDSTKLLAQRSPFIDRAAESDDVLEIGYFNWQEDDRFNKISETRAWNWQQGCMLQWLGPEFNDKIIYNDCVDGKFVSIILDLSSRNKTVLDMPVYSVDNNGKYALCLDFERLYWFRRAYSYPGVKNQKKNVPIDYDTGIWLLDISNNKTRQIINFEELMNISPMTCMQNAVHYIEHLMFSPDGKRFCFLHRWQMKDGGIYTRLYIANIDGGELHLLHDSGRASHFCWRGNHQLLAYCGLKTPFNGLRKNKALAKLLFRPLLPYYHKIFSQRNTITQRLTGDSYVIFNDRDTTSKQVAARKLLKDGHPSFCPANNDVFITDTYPDKKSMAPLMLYDLKSRQLKIVDKLKSVPEHDNSGQRCDLHPRWSFDGKYVTIDTMDQGTRSIYLYEIDHC